MQSLRHSILFVIFILSSASLSADNSMAIVKEWARYAGNTDSAFVVPILNDYDYTYSATYDTHINTGIDIVIIKYNKDGNIVWKQIWSGTGNYRDQPSDMVMDSSYIYLCGITFSSVTNYDYVVMRITKDSGAITWIQTYNGSASNYDIATSMACFNNNVYVTGVSYSLANMGDYHTICYDKTNGNMRWQVDFDYSQLMDIPFDLSVKKDDSCIVITGGSQSTVSDWDYQTVVYSATGTVENQFRVSGSTAGFDRAQAVKTDKFGNIYITGATIGPHSDLDIKTVKLKYNGVQDWIRTYDGGNDDVGNDVLIDERGSVYVCGESHGNDKDFFVQKYDSSGHDKWMQQIDGGGQEDIAYKMCFDSRGNIVVTGKGYNPETYNYDFLTIAFTSDGRELWRDYFDGPAHGNDEARNIVSDEFGNIFVTGQVEGGGDDPTVTIKYRTDYFLEPPQLDSPAVACLFYPNSGQLLNTNDSLVTDSVHYYTLHHYPQLYFGYGVMNMVFSHIDNDTATTDTLQRVDVSFLNSINPTKAYPIDEKDSSGYLNYFLGQCPQGITHVLGNGKLLYKDVYDGIDAEYSSNQGGLKLYFIANPYSDEPNQIGLKFEGHNSLSVINNWQLRINSAIGYYELQKPKAYQLDANGGYISLPWHLNWAVSNGNEAYLTGWGSFDRSLPLIVEVGNSFSNNAAITENLYWSSYYGGPGIESAGSLIHDDNTNLLITSTTASPSIPLSNGFQLSYGLNHDVLISKFSELPGNGTNLTWASYFGGNGSEYAKGIDFNITSRKIYFTGNTNSQNLPTKNLNNSSFFYSALQSNNSCPINLDAFLAECTEDGSALIYSTYIGGGSCEAGFALAIDQTSQNVYLVGETLSDQSNLPAFPLITSMNPSSYNQNSYGGTSNGDHGDGFVMKFDASDNCVWSTYFGGSGDDEISGVVISNNKVIIVGSTNSTIANNPPYSGLPCLSNSNGNFPDCNLGGTKYYDGTFNSYSNTDYDVFLGAFNFNDQLIWSTYFGGWAEDHVPATDPISTTYFPSSKFAITGLTKSGNSNSPSFPVSNTASSYNQNYAGSDDAFVSVFDDFDLLWSSFLGGSGSDFGLGLTFDEYQKLILIGNTTSSSSQVSCGPPASNQFPICDGGGLYYADPGFNSSSDAFISAFDSYGEMVWSTYIGGGSSDEGFSIIADHSKIFSYGDSQSPNTNPYPQVYLNNYYWQFGTLSGGNNDYDTHLSMFKNENVVGIQPVFSSGGICYVYPNPSKKNLNVNLQTKNFEGVQQVRFKIIDILGNINASGFLQNVGENNFSTELDISQLPPGLYCIVFDDENVLLAKFIKQ